MAQTVKNQPAMKETDVRSQVGKICWRKEWLPIPVFSPGEPHGQRSLVGHSPWGHKKLDMIEHTCTQIDTVMKRVDIQPSQGLLFIINNMGYFLCVYSPREYYNIRFSCLLCCLLLV